MQREGEASVDEILASIKKVIARDVGEQARATRRRRETDGVRGGEPAGEAPFEPPFERPAASAIDAAPEPADADEAEEVLELGEHAMIDDDEGYEGGEDVADHEGEPDAGQGAPLTGEATRRTMRETFGALEAIARPGARPRIVRSGETSLEELTRDLLRPMLAEWLDRNLPPLVERLVKDEIARIAGKTGAD